MISLELFAPDESDERNLLRIIYQTFKYIFRYINRNRVQITESCLLWSGQIPFSKRTMIIETGSSESYRDRIWKPSNIMNNQIIWLCLAYRKENWGEVWRLSSNIWKVLEWEWSYSLWSQNRGQEPVYWNYEEGGWG